MEVAKFPDVGREVGDDGAEVGFTVDGDTAHAVTGSAGHVTVHADGTRSPEENRELFVLARTSDG